MKITVLFLHRVESFEGQYAPEAICVVDELTLVDNHTWWPEEVERQKAIHTDNSVASWAEVTIDLPMDAVMNALYPVPTILKAEVV